MVIWSLQVAIRGTVSLTAYKTQLKNVKDILAEAIETYLNWNIYIHE